MIQEGVIRFNIDHHVAALNERQYAPAAAALLAWREILRKLAAVGQDQDRYEGAGFGNLSVRVGAPALPVGRRTFLTTGTQTSGQRCMDLSGFSLVERYDVAANSVRSSGGVQPSSESMTHGALYDLSPSIRAVFHGHCPLIWQRAQNLRLPTTDPQIEYGTPEMAREIQRVAATFGVEQQGVVVMGGHQDGVVAFGPAPDIAGSLFVRTLVHAYHLVATKAGGLCSDRD